MAGCSCSGSVKRTFSETIQSSDDKETTNTSKRIKNNRKVTESSDAQYDDSAYDPSVGNTPCSSTPLTPLRSVQPSSSGYTSDRSENLSLGSVFSLDAQNLKEKFGTLSNPHQFKVFLRENFSRLKNEIDACGIADILHGHELISYKDIESIDEEKSRREQCDLLIKAIYKSTEIKDELATLKVLAAFRDEGYEHLLNCSPRKDKVLPTHADWTSENTRSIFYMYGRQLEDELSPLDIIDILVDVDVLNLDEHQNIKDISFKPTKVKSLCKYILRKDVKKFWWFCKVLDDHNYSALADLLRQKGKNMADPVPIVQTRKKLLSVKVAHIRRDLSSDSDTDSDEDETNVKLEFGDDGKEEEKIVVDNYDGDKDVNFQQEVIELGYRISKMKFSSVRIKLTGLCRHSQMYMIKKCQESPSFLESWLKHLLSDAVIKQLNDKGTDTVKFEIKIKLPKIEDRKCCACKITKSWIVDNFSDLLEMENIKQLICKQIIGNFATYEGFDKKTRNAFDNISGLDDNERTDQFLRTLLDLPDDEVHLCLLEKELRANGHGNLIEPLSSKDVDITATSVVTVQDIRGNLALLLDEIEPRRFVDMLRTMNNSDAIIEHVTSTDPRKERCMEFLNFIMKEGANAIKKFIHELERLRKQHIIEALCEKQTTMHDEIKIKEAVIAMHSEIIDEIEPLNLRQMFVDRKLIKAKKFDGLCKVPSRRARANHLFLHVLEQDSAVLNCFIDAMQVAGYRQLVTIIKQEMQKYTECPRLVEVYMKDRKAIKFKGEYKIDFETGFLTETPLQVYLHKLAYLGEKIMDANDSAKRFVLNNDLEMENIRKERTKQWIQNLEFDKSKKRTNEEHISIIDDEPCKRPCKENDWVVRENFQAPPPAQPEDDRYDICSTTVGYPSEQSSRCGSPSRIITSSADSGIQLSSQGKVCMSALPAVHPGNDKYDQCSTSQFSPSSADSGIHSSSRNHKKKLKIKLLRNMSVSDESCRSSCVSIPLKNNRCTPKSLKSDDYSSESMLSGSCASKASKGGRNTHKPYMSDSRVCEMLTSDTCLSKINKSDSDAPKPLKSNSCTSESFQSDSVVSKGASNATTKHIPSDKFVSDVLKSDSGTSKALTNDSCASKPLQSDKGASKTLKSNSSAPKPVKSDRCVPNPIKSKRCVSKPVKSDKDDRCKSRSSKGKKCTSNPIKSDSCPSYHRKQGISRSGKIRETGVSQSDVVKTSVDCLSDYVEKGEDFRSSNITNFFSSFRNTRASVPAIWRTVNLMFSMLQIGLGRK